VHLKGDSLPRVCSCLNGVTTAFGPKKILHDEERTRKSNPASGRVHGVASDVIRCNCLFKVKTRGSRGSRLCTNFRTVPTQAELLTLPLTSAFDESQT
jgi:hypothetical protein